MKTITILLALYLSLTYGFSQDKDADYPKTKEFYLFYLHGGVVQQQGKDAISPYFGKYEYTAIVDTLESKGFFVISEVRPKATIEKEYALHVKAQVDSLLKEGNAPENVVVVGASQGAYIAMETALLLKNSHVKFVLIGLCSEYAVKYYANNNHELYGNFLSIYEKTDTKGSCLPVFAKGSGNYKFEEIQLNMGNSHSFLFKPYDEWVGPLTAWAWK